MSTFKDMAVGDIAVVTNVSGSGQLRKRMLDFGLTRGAKVELIRKAPLGDPIEIQLRGFRLTIRKVEADIVELDIITPAKEVSE
ncbi:MAG: FeoA domain-containing protein [Candidatus Methanomethylophilus sp.]|jgi:Fe2+ transport system protein FeoA|nr:ferrous iron transport protein A FeoA [methanogenic archaeon ISO4-H5]MBO5519629.1 FeoA domain-containing protein [Methanomethylophilus sp.]MBO5600567.1 FeoA domain-containing protein [Methanomethylophilus sp.]MEE3363833.1 FeoA domain-containing protein [Methanomethylophilus sp.]MEE3478110.1 FeoA domain-containing protein [Methanomethylophilus sp.]